jgi:hypothetical protein
MGEQRSHGCQGDDGEFVCGATANGTGLALQQIENLPEVPLVPLFQT